MEMHPVKVLLHYHNDRVSDRAVKVSVSSREM